MVRSSGGFLFAFVYRRSQKNLENICKHRIDFADVPDIFDGSMLVELDERTDYGEDRWIGIGFLRNGVAVVVGQNGKVM
jgi:uncharacterized DUF497 family protein